MGYIIRKYKESDREAVRDICHKTATAPDYVADKALVSALYAEYYADYEAEHIFILARDTDDIAVGYILCAPDFKRYAEQFKKYQLPKVKKISRKHAFLNRLGMLTERLDTKEYPAHLHIDILPEAQRQGFGTALMNALFAHLREIGVKGVKLGVGGDNEMGISFYKKYGFTLLRDFGKSGKSFGLRLDNRAES